MSKSAKSAKSAKSDEKQTANPINVCGNGELKMCNGDKYTGEYLANLKKKEVVRHGKGIYKTWDGQIYDGIWENDKLLDTTETKITFADNNIYSGLITNQEFIQGTYFFFDGSRLIGSFINNKPTTEILFTDVNNRIWITTLDGNFMILRYPNLHKYIYDNELLTLKVD